MAAKATFSAICMYRQLHLTPMAPMEAPHPEICHNFRVIQWQRTRHRRFTIIRPFLFMLYVCSSQFFKEGPNFQKHGNMYTWKEWPEAGASNEIGPISVCFVFLELLTSQAVAVHMLLEISELARLRMLISQTAPDRRQLFWQHTLDCPSTNFLPNLVSIG